MGTGFNAFLNDPAKITGAVGGLVALTTGYFASKGSLGVLFRFVEARLGQLSLRFATRSIGCYEFWGGRRWRVAIGNGQFLSLG